jgi:hypothetical protein
MSIRLGNTIIAPGEAPADGGTYARKDGEWAALGTPAYTLKFSDLANTSGDVGGSLADTGQTYVVTGSGTTPPRKPFFAEDARGGYLRPTDLAANTNEVNTYILSSIAPHTVHRVAVVKKGPNCTIAINLAAPTDPNVLSNMIHVRFDQDTGTPDARYWKSATNEVGVAFKYNAKLSNPIADPDAPRLYEIEVIGDAVVSYCDGVITGVAYDPVVPDVTGLTFYTQFQDENDRIYEIRAWTRDDASADHPTVLAPLLESELVASTGLHVGNRGDTGYAPNTNFYVLSNSPTFRGVVAGSGCMTALFQSRSGGCGTTINLWNGENRGIELYSGAGGGTNAVVGVIRAWRGTSNSPASASTHIDRIQFPSAHTRVDFPVPVKAVALAHVVALTYAATLETDASAGDVFDITLTGNVTLANPTNPINGKTLTWRFLQDGDGEHTITLGDKFVVPSTITSPLAWGDTADTLSIISAMYHAGRDKWDIVNFQSEY